MSKLIIYKNTDRAIIFTYPSSTDLNGDTIYFTVKEKLGGKNDDSDAIITGEVTVSTSTNVATISLSDTTTNVKPGLYLGDIKKVDSSGNITGYSSFDVEVVQTVTQRSS